jgi:opacity protein-like surface antigen
MRPLRLMAVFTAVLAAASAAAAGDFVVTGNAGGAFGGKTDDTRFTWGVDLSSFGNDVFGWELSFSQAPDFFGGPDTPLVPDNNLTTLMANLLANKRFGDGWSRLYAAGGIGLIQSHIDETQQLLEVDSNEFGFNVGGGVVLALSDRLGLRGDLRYFRAITDPEPDDEFDVDLGSLDFWRASAGLSINF